MVHRLANLLKSCIHMRHLTLTNVNTNANTPHKNTIPPWILNCTCNTSKCICLAKLMLDIIYIRGAPFEQSGPLNPTPDLII